MIISVTNKQGVVIIICCYISIELKQETVTMWSATNKNTVDIFEWIASSKQNVKTSAAIHCNTNYTVKIKRLQFGFLSLQIGQTRLTKKEPIIA